MSLAIDRPGSGDPDTRAGARRAEAAALRAADFACDAYRDTLAEPLRDTARPDRVIAVIHGGTDDSLASAVADLGSAAFAAARAAHLAVELGSPEEAEIAGNVAARIAATARTGVIALQRHGMDDEAQRVVELAHDAALAAHLATGALSAFDRRAHHITAFPGSAPRPAVAFPASWRGHIEDLGRRLSRARRQVDGDPVARDLLHAADAACAAAHHALRVYQHTGNGSPLTRATCRVARITALAACFAGAAALGLLEQRTAH